VHKVSVIIPVYNSEQFLHKCLDSVISQTLAEIEIICIDDCSIDGSKKILKSYLERDKRIKILCNEENMGPSFSRNKAVEAATGEYIQFLDSDDYLYADDVLEDLYTISSDNKLDLLKSRTAVYQNGCLSNVRYPECISDNVYSGKELLYEMVSHHILVWNTTSNFVKREFLIENNILFFHGIVHEDVLFSYEVYYCAKKAMCVNKSTYIYIKRENSITTRQKNISHLKGYLTCMDELLKKDFMDSALEFRYATVYYFMCMYNEVSNIRKKMKYDIDIEALDDSGKKIYALFWGKMKYINIKKVMQKLNEIVQCGQLYIYGAGRAANELLEFLAEYDVAIDGIFVTDVEKNPKTLLGHRIKGINEYTYNGRRALFLVAITKAYVGNTMELLNSKGIENIIYVC